MVNCSGGPLWPALGCTAGCPAVAGRPAVVQAANTSREASATARNAIKTAPFKSSSCDATGAQRPTDAQTIQPERPPDDENRAAGIAQSGTLCPPHDRRGGEPGRTAVTLGQPGTRTTAAEPEAESWLRLTATVTATAATNGYQQQPATARDARTIRANSGYARSEKRKIGRAPGP